MSLFNLEAIQPNITTEYILERYTEDQLYLHYFPDFILGDVLSPFREESSASFGFYQSKEPPYNILWKDSARQESGGVFHFIKKLHKQQGWKGTFTALLQKIAIDMSTSTAPGVTIIDKEKKTTRSAAPKRKNTKIEIEKTAEGTIPEVFMYIWERLGITRNILDMYNAGFAESVWIYKTVDGKPTQQLWGRSTINNPIFYYLFPESGHIKCYRPLDKDRKSKWIMNCNNTDDVQGLAQCNIEVRRPRLLVITKSMKDVMFLRTLGIDAIAFHGEGYTGSINPALIQYLKLHCGLVISLYDNDWAGIRGGIYLRETYGIPLFFYPQCYGAKDSTDAYLAMTPQRYFLLVEILNEILHERYNNRYTGIGTSIAA